MRKAITYILISSMILCSCNKEASVESMQRIPMAFGASVETGSSKAIVEDSTLPASFTILASMSISSSTTEQTGDYFVGRTFHKDVTFWKPDGASIYWPLGSTLDILALSCDQQSLLEERTTWNTGCSTKGLTMRVNEGECLATDILYASSINLNTPGTPTESVNLNFKHTQAWLRFTLETEMTGMVFLSKITLKNVYDGGLLVINRENPISPGQFYCDWDFHGISLDDLDVPGVSGQELGETPISFDILIPWQYQRDIELEFNLKNTSSDPTPTKVKKYTIPANPRYWYDGEKYVYGIEVSAMGIEVGEVSVEPWGGKNIPINMQP